MHASRSWPVLLVVLGFATTIAGCDCNSREPAIDGAVTVDGAIPDAVAPDANLVVCDPLAAPGLEGCASGDKCTWVIIDTAPTVRGVATCVAAGALALDASCTAPAVGEGDACAAGLVCVDGSCHDICAVDLAAGCADGFACARYADLFANGTDVAAAGTCNQTCDPVTQLTTAGPACGTDKGCYLLMDPTDTAAVCSSAGTPSHGMEITTVAYANSCEPGAQPRRRSPLETTLECGALCQPVEVTSTSNQTHESGVAPNSCEIRGAAPPESATAGESCRFLWVREGTDDLTQFSNTTGWCFKHAVFQYDTDSDGTPDAPFPRCTSLTTGDVVPPIGNPVHNDAQYFWCVALAAGPPAQFTLSDEPLIDRLAPPW